MQQSPTQDPRSGIAATLRVRLRRETATLHEEVERALPLVSRRLTVDRYRRVLESFHGFYRPHEEWLAHFGSRVPFPMPRRAERLAKDLRILGLSDLELELLPRCAVPLSDRIEELAGWLYVMEGAALGGQVVARALRENLRLDSANGAAFFTGDGAATGTRWRQVVRWLEEVARDDDAPVIVIDSARATFLRLRDWLERLHD